MTCLRRGSNPRPSPYKSAAHTDWASQAWIRDSLSSTTTCTMAGQPLLTVPVSPARSGPELAGVLRACLEQ
jgi:hypothetical protein